jgi:hypothetical protein
MVLIGLSLAILGGVIILSWLWMHLISDDVQSLGRFTLLLGVIMVFAGAAMVASTDPHWRD